MSESLERGLQQAAAGQARRRDDLLDQAPVRSHGQPAHQGGLCELEHYCPSCEAGGAPGDCLDLFISFTCGLVACATEAGPT